MISNCFRIVFNKLTGTIISFNLNLKITIFAAVTDPTDAMSEFDPRSTTDRKDNELDGIIRPQQLDDFTGQKEIV